MAEQVLLEYAAKPDHVEDIAREAERFVEVSLDREAHLARHEAYRIEATRTFVHLLTFEDGLAARDHRTAKHTERFTEAIQEGIEGDLDVRELEPVSG